jgi:hypothetical protein
VGTLTIDTCDVCGVDLSHVRGASLFTHHVRRTFRWITRSDDKVYPWELLCSDCYYGIAREVEERVKANRAAAVRQEKP